MSDDTPERQVEEALRQFGKDHRAAWRFFTASRGNCVELFNKVTIAQFKFHIQNHVSMYADAFEPTEIAKTMVRQMVKQRAVLSKHMVRSFKTNDKKILMCNKAIADVGVGIDGNILKYLKFIRDEDRRR